MENAQSVKLVVYEGKRAIVQSSLTDFKERCKFQVIELSYHLK